MSRIKVAFSALIFTQLAHSIEEYVGRLWESFPPARFLTGMISSDRELGFIVLNSALVAFGLWCLLFPVRKEWPSAAAFIWFWIVLETINGVAHPVWALRQGGYTPGVLTAPLLLVISLYLAFHLRGRGRPFSPAA
ncbi:MAG TPA: HXXEE domain-containing protein [Gemmatimonadaceae bacterium]|nr:HXXEE domain-containing protein [Gemmatimonadaceae bacterium]